ncbi:MAG TPA: hypothetical protein VLA93_17290 [Pyrinomonadaceae bacterium]|nr:hypothetical protein [Pyrinomonadaceae bacterium]
MNAASKKEVELVGFALGNCLVEISPTLEKYLRIVHRTALELAVQNQFGVEVGGFWLMRDQIAQLRRLPEYYSGEAAANVRLAVEAYLLAQLNEINLNEDS